MATKGDMGPAFAPTPQQPLTPAQRRYLDIIKKELGSGVFKPYDLPYTIPRPEYVCRVLKEKGYLAWESHLIGGFYRLVTEDEAPRTPEPIKPAPAMLTAIKEIRARTGMSLKDAKETVDGYLRDHPAAEAAEIVTAVAGVAIDGHVRITIATLSTFTAGELDGGAIPEDLRARLIAVIRRAASVIPPEEGA